MFEEAEVTWFSDDNDNISIPDAIIFISLCSLAVLYIYLFLKGTQSFTKIKKHSNSTEFGQVFFLFLVFVSAGRIAAFTLTAIKLILNTYGTDLDLILKLLTSLRYLPDVFFILAFALLGWLVITVFLIGLIQLNDYKVVARSQKNIYFVIWVILALIFGASEIVAFILLWFDVLEEKSYLLMNSIINFAAMFVVFLCEIILHCIFSGVPWKSQFHKDRFAKANRLLIIWAMSRVVEGGLGLYECIGQPIWEVIINSNNITSFSDLVGPILFTVELCVAEVWPILISMDNETIALFLVRSEVAVDGSSQIQPRSRFDTLRENLLKDEPAINGGSANSSLDQGSELSIEGRPLILSSEEITFDDDRIEISDDKLGVLKGASRGKKEKLFVRCIKLNKLTAYVTEGVKNDANRLGKLTFPYINKVRGYYFSGLEINIIFKREMKGSLHDLLHSTSKSDKEKVNTNLKLRIAKNVAKGMNHLHSQQIPIIHGHLTPHNILLDESFAPKITDYGFETLKKYANMVGGYSNLSQYTAPEIFSEKGKYKSPEDPAVDVYSFGMILWELSTEKIPFEGMQRTELYKRICVDNSRPKIPENITEPLSSLIRACWQQDPAKRPQFHYIEGILEDVIDN